MSKVSSKVIKKKSANPPTSHTSSGEGKVNPADQFAMMGFLMLLLKNLVNTRRGLLHNQYAGLSKIAFNTKFVSNSSAHNVG